ncbi:MAG: hypothetical protein UDD07_04695 [Lachnospiraceae bacterium]|nr:hypothetical protein [Lachnospiraceae bacterium]
MDLIYTDKNRKDIDVLSDYELDEAFGKNENNFSLKISLSEHCMEPGCVIYAENTEYGGIIDTLNPNTKDSTLTYKGRTWHGILNSKVLEPDAGEDYLILSGEANSVLKEIITRLKLNDVFSVSEEDSGIEIIHYQCSRYPCAYDEIRKMLYEFMGKLTINCQMKTVLLSVSPLYDYSADEEWDASQLDFAIEKNYHPVNHLICLGSGDLKDRHVIHLFTDENGGIQPYSFYDNPYQDADYILDKRNQILKEQEEVVEVYDYGNAQDTVNYVLLTSKPQNWQNVYTNFFIAKDDKFEQLTKTVERTYEVLASQPSDWSKRYASYFKKNGSGYANVDGVVQESYVKMSKKPVDWDKNYANYYVYFSDGLTSEYQGVSGVSKDRYRLQTQRPSDWSVTFNNYFKKVNVYKFFYDEYKKDKSGTWIKARVVKDSQVQNEITDKHALIFMEKVSVGIEYKALEKKAPKWKKNTFYTKISKQYPPKWRSGYYYRRKEETVAPEFKAGSFYQERSGEVIPSWKPNSYYIERTDHFADLVKNGIEKLKSYYNDEKITTSLDASISYDVGDVIGSREQVTGVQAAQPITKKILKITSDGNTVSYEIGE